MVTMKMLPGPSCRALEVHHHHVRSRTLRLGSRDNRDPQRFDEATLSSLKLTDHKSYVLTSPFSFNSFGSSVLRFVWSAGRRVDEATYELPAGLVIQKGWTCRKLQEVGNWLYKGAAIDT